MRYEEKCTIQYFGDGVKISVLYQYTSIINSNHVKNMGVVIVGSPYGTVLDKYNVMRKSYENEVCLVRDMDDTKDSQNMGTVPRKG